MTRAIHYASARTHFGEDPDPGIKFQKFTTVHSSNWVRPTAIIYDEDGELVLTNSATSTVAPFGQGLVVDLSDLMSQVTGRQQSQCANYRVTDIQIEMRNVDNADDNNRAHFFQGHIEWLSPNRHLIDTIQAFRAIRRELAQLELSGSSEGGATTLFEKYFPQDSFSPAQPYKAFRFGLSRDDDIRYADMTLKRALGLHNGNDDEVQADTNYIGLQNRYFGEDGLSIAQMLSTVKRIKHAGDSQDYDENDPPNKLWMDRAGRPNRLPFSVGINNASNGDDIGNLTLGTATNNNASFQSFTYNPPAGTHIDVCTGLMYIQFTHCNATPDIEEVTSIHDDHEFIVSIGVEGWSEW